MLALFEPPPLDGGGVGERVKNETCGVFAADPLSRRAAPGRSPSALKAMDGRKRPRADLSHKGRGIQLRLEANWVCA
jgi:hypothetical protein